MKENLVAIIILNWNGLENTKKCIDSLLKIDYQNYKILVIDNGSKNHEASILKKRYRSKIEVFPLPENIGFTGGCNFGISEAKKYNPEFFLLLNNDTEVDRNFLKNLVSTVSTDKKIGVASPMIFDYKYRNKIIFSGGYINWLFGKTFHKVDNISSVKECNFITGCCFLIKKNLIEKIGVLDNRFFAYFEDSAYSLKTIKAGYKCICDPSSIIFHKEGASTNKTGPFKTYLISRNRILFVNNYAPKIFKYYFFIFNIFKLFFALTYFMFTGQNKRIYAYTKGYIDGTLGKGGTPSI